MVSDRRGERGIIQVGVTSFPATFKEEEIPMNQNAARGGTTTVLGYNVLCATTTARLRF